MATTPYFIWPSSQVSSAAAAASDSDVAGFGAPAETAMAAAATATEMAVVSTELASSVARPRLRRQSSGSGKQQQQQAGGNKKPPQRGLGVAELERLRCGGDPLRDINAAAVVAVGDAANNLQGLSVLHHHRRRLPAFDAATGARYYSQLLVQPSPAPSAPPAPVCCIHPHSAGGQSVAPEHQYFMDRWARMGGFPAGNAAGRGHQHQVPLAPAPEHPSSQNTIWRPASSSSSSCLHTGHRCDLCSRTMRTLTETGSQTPAAAAATTTTMPEYSIYDLAAAMATGRKENGEAFLAPEGKKKEVREIEFFPTSANHAGGVGPDESESEFAMMRSTPFSSSSGAAPLDLSLRL